MALPAYDESFPGEEPLGDMGDMEEPEPWLPSTDGQTARLVEEAVQALAWSRSVTTPADDPAFRLLCLVSLLAEAEACTYEYIARAYEGGHDWHDLVWATGGFLGNLEETYGPYIEWRATQENHDGAPTAAPARQGGGRGR